MNLEQLNLIFEKQGWGSTKAIFISRPLKEEDFNVALAQPMSSWSPRGESKAKAAYFVTIEGMHDYEHRFARDFPMHLFYKPSSQVEHFNNVLYVLDNGYHSLRFCC